MQLTINLFTLTLAIFFGVTGLAQNDSDNYKNNISIGAQYDRQSLMYTRTLNKFKLRSSLNRINYEPLKAPFRIGDLKIVTLTTLDNVPTSIQDSSATFLYSMERGSEFDLRIGVAYYVELEKFNIFLGVDGVLGKQQVDQTLTEIKYYQIYDSVEAEYELRYDRYDPVEYNYELVKIGVAPFIGIQLIIKRWDISIDYSPELSWRTSLPNEAPIYLYEYSQRSKNFKIKRFSFKDQAKISLGFSF